MLKKTITYPTFDGETVTEDFYFNISKAELVELEVSEKEGFTESIKAIVASSDGKKIIETFKHIILMAVGRKSEDGKRFIKNDQIREEFSQTEAYSQLFVELATDAGAAAEFINSVIPQDLAAQVVTQQQLDLPATDAQVEATMAAEVPVSEENIANIEAAAGPDFSTMSPEEFTAWQAQQG